MGLEGERRKRHRAESLSHAALRDRDESEEPQQQPAELRVDDREPQRLRAAHDDRE